MIELTDIIKKSNFKNVKIFCDYIFNYSKKIDKLKTILKNTNDILFIELNRDTHRVFHNDNIIYDLIPHDLTILYKLFDIFDIKLNFVDRVKNTENLLIKSTVGFEIKNLKGVINTEFLSHQKNRKIKIVCEDKIIMYDDTTNIIEIFNYKLTRNEFQTIKNIMEQETILNTNDVEPLMVSISEFIRLVNEKDEYSYNKNLL
jgi:predicted dehydrogenase